VWFEIFLLESRNLHRSLYLQPTTADYCPGGIAERVADELKSELGAVQDVYMISIEH